MHEGRAQAISPNAKKHVKRSQRPVHLRRRTTSSSGDTTPKASPIGIDQVVLGLDRLDMAASFLQYCATCEKQIMTPSNSILYCSEACRRKDSCKPLSLSASAMTTPPSSVPSSPRPILPPRTPTGSSHSDMFSTRIPTELHNAKSDLDPTEWKPKLHRRGNSHYSEAHRYLSCFYKSTTAASEDNEKMEHLAYGHRSNTSMASMATPSLANTPATSISSVSTSAGYDFATRPLLSRQNPSYSASSGMTKGLDLVTPHVAPDQGIAPSVPVSGKAYEKKAIVKGAPAGQEGLWALIGKSVEE